VRSAGGNDPTGNDDGTGNHDGTGSDNDDRRDHDDNHHRQEAAGEEAARQEAGSRQEGRQGSERNEDPRTAGARPGRVHRVTAVSAMPHLRGRGRAALPLALACFLAVTLLAAARSSAAPATVKPTQELVRLLRPHVARSAPDDHAARLEVLRAQRPLTGERTTLPVLGRRAAAGGATWLHVALPGRPNSHTGWIKQQDTASVVTPWHLVVDVSLRRVTVYRNGHAFHVFSAVVGKPSTPTPRGEFFVEEDVALRAGDVGAPYALALSARSDVFQEFEGGPGQIALHGLANVGGVPGTAASHGCIRLDAASVTWLVARIGPGVPVTVTN
jgi:lipoprotein-anchoring transpeptidase ErfK/SrfK